MREIGFLNNAKQAQDFSDYLLVEGIENKIDEEEGVWIIWIYSEEEVATAENLLKNFKKEPEIIATGKISQKANKIREKEETENAVYQKLMKKSKVIFGSKTGIGKITRILIIISVIIGVFSLLGKNWQFLRYIAIADYNISGNMISWAPGLREVSQGQIWRLITPIFIHYDIFHILFNMFWLYYLGSQVENIQGTKIIILLVLTIAIIPNVCQFYVSGPGFGGMSGVNYGLLGYIWMRAKFDPLCGLNIEKYLIVWMMFWFFLGLTGFIGHIANIVHGVGLVTGMAWGYILARMSPHFRK